jgi:hypothetical protein
MTPERQAALIELRVHFTKLVQNYSPSWRERGEIGLKRLMVLEDWIADLQRDLAAARSCDVQPMETQA